MAEHTQVAAAAAKSIAGPVTMDGATRERVQAMTEQAREALDRCLGAGADQAEVSLNSDRGLSVGVRNGEVETIEYTRDSGLSVTVYFGQRKGSASTADLLPTSVRATVERACEIARYTESDPAAGLADAERMAREFPDFDLWHPWDIRPEQAIELALRAEAAGREADARISTSDGATLATGQSLSIYANSHGFVGIEHSTEHSLGCGLIAGSGTGMQHDHWYSNALAPEDIEAPEAIGRRAAARAVGRLNPRPVRTGTYPVLFEAPAARSLIKHLLAAVSGGALYRRASFLLDSVDTQLFPERFSIIERPHLRRGFRSTAFDAEGVATRESALVENGVLRRYLLGSYSARRLGLETTGNAGGAHNLEVADTGAGFDDLLHAVGTGLLVTELMGQGVNPVTGDYSRGASGFWVENGEIAYPVDEITVAGTLRQMFRDIIGVGRDIDPRSHIHTGSILVSAMTVAGQGQVMG